MSSVVVQNEARPQRPPLRTSTQKVKKQASREVKLEKREEQELIRRSQKGDRDAYRVLVELYQDRAFAIAIQIVKSREDAEDIVQESLVKAYLSLKNFRGDSRFYTWLYRIVYNMSIDFKRKVIRRGGQVEFEEQGQHNLGDSVGAGRVASPSEAMDQKETLGLINKALEEMSEEHRAVIMLREVDGLSYDEIAKVVGVTKGTVMSRLHYARKKLQAALSEIAPEGHAADAESVAKKEGVSVEAPGM